MSEQDRSSHIGLLHIVDIELTNRCNAHCGFCPRDATPHQGLMAPDVLEQAVARVVEVREQVGTNWPNCHGVSFCGLGDQLLHPHVTRYVRTVRDAGLDVAVNTNGALLDAERGQRLLDGGVSRVFVNGGEIGEAYEDLYGLPFERVRENVQRFASMSQGRCDFYVVLVNHQNDAHHVDEIESFWRSQGVRRFYRLELLNRAGSLHLDDMDYERFPREQQEARTLLAASRADHPCRAPFYFPFIGYDGNYYLCGSDWQKDVPVGNVFEHSILEVVRTKLDHVRSREPICRSCNHDPLNRLTSVLVARGGDHATQVDVDEFVLALRDEAAEVDAIEQRVGAILTRVDPVVAQVSPTRRRKLIPVRVT